jgi:hypothetical protein
MPTVALSRSEDETEIGAGERIGDKSREEDPWRAAATLPGARSRSGLGALWPVKLTQAYARAAAIFRYKLSAARL